MFYKPLEIEVGPVPCEEECAQVCDADYDERSKLESAVYIRQLRRVFGEPDPARLTFVRRSFPHEFGRYHEVVACITGRWDEVFDERKLPSRWDNIALAELTWVCIRARYLREAAAGVLEPQNIPELYSGTLPDFPDHPIALWMARGYAPTMRPALAYH